MKDERRVLNHQAHMLDELLERAADTIDPELEEELFEIQTEVQMILTSTKENN